MFKKVITIGTTIAFLALLLLALVFVGTLVPLGGGYQLRIVESGSMEPTITTGSVVFISPRESYDIGDVVTFKRTSDANFTTHRIIGIEEEGGEVLFSMQGDANTAADLRPVRTSEIQGEAWFSIPYLGYAINFIKTPAGFAVMVGVPLLYIVYEQMRTITNVVRNKNDHNKKAV